MPIAVLEPILDTYVDEANPAVAYGTLAYMTASYAGGNEKKAYVKWDLTPGVNIPAGATIIDVRLRLWPSSITEGFWFTVNRLTSAFNEATTWAGKPTASTDHITLFNVGSTRAVANSQIVLDYNYVRDIAKRHKDYIGLLDPGDIALLQLVRDWYSGAVVNHGLALQVSSRAGAWGLTVYTREDTLAHRRPILEVEYCTADALPAAYSSEPEGFYGRARDLLERELVTNPTCHLYVELADGTEYDLIEDLRGTSGLRRHLPFVGEQLALEDYSFVLDNQGGKYSETDRDSIFYAGRLNGAYLRHEIEIEGQTKTHRGIIKRLIDHGDGRAEILVGPFFTQYLDRILNTPRSTTAYGVSNHEGAPYDELGPLTGAGLLYEAIHNYAGVPDADLNLDRFAEAKAVHTAQGMYVSAIWEARTLGDELRGICDATLTQPYVDGSGDLAAHVWEPSDPTTTDEPKFRSVKWWEDKSRIANTVKLNAKWSYPSEVDRASDGYEVELTDHESAAEAWGPKTLGIGTERLEAYNRPYPLGFGHYIAVRVIASMQARFYLQALAYPFYRGEVVGGVELLRYDLNSTFLLREDSRGIKTKVRVVDYDMTPGIGGQPWTIKMGLVPCNWPYPWKDYVNILSWRLGAPTPTYSLTLAAPTPVDPVTRTVNSNSTNTTTVNWTYTPGLIPPDGFLVLLNHGTTAGQPVPTLAAHDQQIRLIGGGMRSCTFQLPADNYATIAVGAYAESAGKELISVLADSAAAPDWVDILPTAGEYTAGNTPTNDPAPTVCNVIADDAGSETFHLEWTYAQGAIAADGLILLANHDPGSPVAIPTGAADAHVAVYLSPDAVEWDFIGIEHTEYYTFAIVAYRNTATGPVYGNVVSSPAGPDWQSVRADDHIEFAGDFLNRARTKTLLSGDTERLHADVEDSGGRLVTDMFDKTADDLDDVGDGATYSRVKTSAIDGAGDIAVINDAPVPVSGILTKTMRIPAAQFTPATEVQLWSLSGGSVLNPGAAGVDLTAFAAVVLPTGVTITSFYARLYRDAGHDTAYARLYRSGDAGGLTAITAEIHGTAGGWSSNGAGGLAETTAGDTYIVLAYLEGVDGGADAGINKVEITYTMPDFGKAI